jgi:hypothetical protein
VVRLLCGCFFLVQRLVLIAIAVALAVLGALRFHRFDPARALPRRRAAARPSEAAARWEFAARRPATRARFGPPGFRLVRTSLRVLLAGVSRWWWWAGALFLSLIAAVVPARTIGPALLPLCWIWPVLLWSRLGTPSPGGDVLATYPRRLARISATWLGGVLLTAVTGAVPLIRLLSAGINFMAAVGPNPALVAVATLALFLLAAAWQELRHARR